MKLSSAALLLALGSLGGGWLVSAAEPADRYALILADPAAAERVSSLKSIRSAPALSYRAQIRAAQTSLKRDLAERNIRVTGSAETVLNAVFVSAPSNRLAELRSLPCVKAVVPLHRFRLHLNKALPLQNISAAWSAVGGEANAGAGIKIAIIDTGIDQNHPAFQDSSLHPPSGFPKCTAGVSSDCSFTNNKVIVARSYVAELASGALNPDGLSRPDDITPRDHIGHGTALASIVAGETSTGPSGITITGIAPKAWVGSYKVFGSPGLNDFTGGDVLIRAIEDAVNDGMDIAVLSLGSPAFTGPLDTGAICGLPTGPQQYCDAEAVAVNNAVAAGMLVFSSAGNSGDSGQNTTSMNTLESPADAPLAVAAGASENSHQFSDGIRVLGSDVPSSLQFIAATFGDGPLPSTPLTAPLIDVTSLDSSGFGCNSLAANSLSGDFVLMTRGNCNFSVKVVNAQNAGAAGVIFVDNVQEDISLVAPGGLTGTAIPSALIGATDGATLRSYVAAHPGVQMTLGNSVVETNDPAVNSVAYFSSRGPSITYLAKPEAMGVGTSVYMATQKYDPNGEMYDATGYVAASGTSFSAPMLAGAAALVKQKNPGFTTAQLKSAVVGTATQDVTDNGQTADETAAGNGKLNGGNAVQTTVTTDPATIAFSGIGNTTPNCTGGACTLTVFYSGSVAANLSLTVTGTHPPTVSPTTLAFTPGSASKQVTLTMASTTTPGLYEGTITIQGGSESVRVPYLYVVGDGVPFDIIPLAGQGFDNPAGQSVAGGLALKVIDQFGVAVQNAPVSFTSLNGGGTISSADSSTDVHGVATANAVLASAPGSAGFSARVGNLPRIQFTGIGRATPIINPAGIVNAASFAAGQGVVPGSYVSIFGTDLSDALANATGLPLPLAISETSVSFEVPSANISLPGSLLYADDHQVNVQVPWGLQGQSSVDVRVNVGLASGQTFTVPITQHAPAIYVTGQGTAAALDASFHAITSSNPAVRGQTVELFVNGLGTVDNPPPTGSAAAGNTLIRTAVQPTVKVGGQDAPVSFSGLAPGFPGLYQVNITVPASAAAGSDPVVVSIGGIDSPAVNMPVR